DPTLFIQAHEADISRGPYAKAAAESLEIYEYDYTNDGSRNTSHLKVGSALMKWGDEAQNSMKCSVFIEDDDVGMPPVGREEDDIWVDRYDARLLLDVLPPKYPPNSIPIPSSPGGWSDLPSDSEDMFFFSAEEIEDIRREKRRKVMERDHEERLKARMAEDGEEPEEIWGGSDEEAEETQMELMKRTATHLLSSPNPAQLEMRILANHGNDKRFAFLRGRWSRAWRLVKGKARIEKEERESLEAKEKEQKIGLGGLAGYGDSEEEDEEEIQKEEKEVDEAKAADTKAAYPAVPDVSAMSKNVGNEAAKEARRLRAKQWAEKRRAEKE
ncbi:hypothetical protein BDQ17DRAFT_1223713, partial [Cyathus striatus]